MEIVDQTTNKNPKPSETPREYDSSTSTESMSHNILVVDDDKNLANTFKMILETVGYNVDTAFTGLQALYKINKKTYGLVLLDLNLPDVMGDGSPRRSRNYPDRLISCSSPGMRC